MVFQSLGGNRSSISVFAVVLAFALAALLASGARAGDHVDELQFDRTLDAKDFVFEEGMSILDVLLELERAYQAAYGRSLKLNVLLSPQLLATPQERGMTYPDLGKGTVNIPVLEVIQYFCQRMGLFKAVVDDRIVISVHAAREEAGEHDGVVKAPE